MAPRRSRTAKRRGGRARRGRGAARRAGNGRTRRRRACSNRGRGKMVAATPARGGRKGAPTRNGANGRPISPLGGGDGRASASRRRSGSRRRDEEQWCGVRGGEKRTARRAFGVTASSDWALRLVGVTSRGKNTSEESGQSKQGRKGRQKGGRGKRSEATGAGTAVESTAPLPMPPLPERSSPTTSPTRPLLQSPSVGEPNGERSGRRTPRAPRPPAASSRGERVDDGSAPAAPLSLPRSPPPPAIAADELGSRRPRPSSLQRRAEQRPPSGPFSHSPFVRRSGRKTAKERGRAAQPPPLRLGEREGGFPATPRGSRREGAPLPPTTSPLRSRHDPRPYPDAVRPSIRAPKPTPLPLSVPRLPRVALPPSRKSRGRPRETRPGTGGCCSTARASRCSRRRWAWRRTRWQSPCTWLPGTRRRPPGWARAR